MFETVIGLEVHIQLNTKTKLFCGCSTEFADVVNANTCPTCLALPGSLPVLNKLAVQKAISLGKAISSKINRHSTFERKNYFYPDLPNGYQISQFETPVVEGGFLDIEVDNQTKRINVTRAHLETDAGKNIHESSFSKVDLNRAGTPLLEIVSEPEMRNSDEAVAYLKKLHSIVQYLGVSNANMQEGSFRCDANVSIRPIGDEKLYTRVEIKNLNSFRNIAKAINYEVRRQSDAWEDGTYKQEVVQETRLYDVNKDSTRSMRGKEEAADYRYFPDPDLPPVIIHDDLFKKGNEIPELAGDKKERYINIYKLKEYDAKVLTGNYELSKYFDALMDKKSDPKLSVTWLSVELLGRLKGDNNIENTFITPNVLSLLIAKIKESEISGLGAKKTLDYMMENNDIEIDKIIDKLSLRQVNDDSAIETFVKEVIEANGDKVEQYKNGKDKLLGFFVGQVMKLSKGSANPVAVNKIVKEHLSK
jgi:aspartyl-tRNA(Asn)/glutamyl-tRNA(Gln) amidotransferase subunit B